MTEYQGSDPHGATTGSAQEEANARAADNSLGELLGDLSRNVSTLMRQEVELAKAELKESVTSAGKGAGMYAGAGLAAHFVVLFLSLAAMFGLALWIGYGWAAVIVAGVWALVGVVLAMLAKKQLRTVKGLPQTADTLKEIPPTFNPNEETI